MVHEMGSLCVHTPELHVTLCMHGFVILHPMHAAPPVPQAEVDCIEIGRQEVADAQHPAHEVVSQTHSPALLQ